MAHALRLCTAQLHCASQGCEGSDGSAMARLCTALPYYYAAQGCKRCDGDVLVPSLPQELHQRWEALLLQRTLDRMTDLKYCPRCSAACIEDSDHMAHCSCDYVFCTLCFESWHPGTVCEDLEGKLARMEARSKGKGNTQKGQHLLPQEMIASEFKATTRIQEEMRSVELLKVCNRVQALRAGWNGGQQDALGGDKTGCTSV
jgi:IBR domain, a half RING-finger domain